MEKVEKIFQKKFLIIILFCLLSFGAKATWFAYMYTGPCVMDPAFFKQINTCPVKVDILEKEDIIRIKYEKVDFDYCIIGVDVPDSKKMIKFETIAPNGTKIWIYVGNTIVVLSNGDKIYVITNISKKEWINEL